MSQISDIRADRINLFNLEHRNIKIESYTIFGNQIIEVINDIRFNKKADHYVRALCTNIFRGTAFPIHEIFNNPDVSSMISKVCFQDNTIFKKYKIIIDIIRHILSHNYLPELALRSWDLDGETITKAIQEYKEAISFNYDAHIFFPDAYKKPFSIPITFYTNKLRETVSLFDCISVNNLMFLSEISNNCLWKILRHIRS